MDFTPENALKKTPEPLPSNAARAATQKRHFSHFTATLATTDRSPESLALLPRLPAWEATNT
ncbi:MAG: hypothetical protein HC849_22265 [Oscillatoriales cyanobacterium RU_3_3]|nr:hypothetical protein [Oscillatoriales cyanobacterium RU_3_3]